MTGFKTTALAYDLQNLLMLFNILLVSFYKMYVSKIFKDRKCIALQEFSVKKL